MVLQSFCMLCLFYCTAYLLDKVFIFLPNQWFNHAGFYLFYEGMNCLIQFIQTRYMFGFTFFFLWLWMITWEEMISFTEQQTDQWHVLPTGGSTSSSSSSSSVLREVQWSQNPEQQNERNTKHFSLCISLKMSLIMYKSKAECFSALVFVAAAKKFLFLIKQNYFMKFYTSYYLYVELWDEVILLQT